MVMIIEEIGLYQIAMTKNQMSSNNVSSYGSNEGQVPAAVWNACLGELKAGLDALFLLCEFVFKRERPIFCKTSQGGQIHEVILRVLLSHRDTARYAIIGSSDNLNSPYWTQPAQSSSRMTLTSLRKSSLAEVLAVSGEDGGRLLSVNSSAYSKFHLKSHQVF